MDKPIFVDYESKICSAFLNTVSNTVWDALGQAQTPVQARQFIGAVEEAPNDGGLYLRSNLAWVSASTSLQHNDLAGRSTADSHPISAITGLQSEIDLLNTAIDATAQLGDSIPIINGVAYAGIGTTASRVDHVHPVDTSRAPASASTALGTSFTPAGTIAANTVQAAIAELDSETQTALSGKAPSSAATATGTSFTPTGTIAANNVQTAIAELDSETQPRLVPAGAIMDFAMQTPPAGWLLCNGAVVSRTTYAALFAAIGTAWGAGDGSTTFNVPNFATGDAAVQGVVGSSTNGAVISHTHPTGSIASGSIGGSDWGNNAPFNSGWVTATDPPIGAGTKNLAAGRGVQKCIKT